MDNHPDTVIVNNITQAKALQAKGVICFMDTVKTRVNGIISKKVRFRNIVRIGKILEDSSFDQIMLKDPKIQKLFHVNVPEDDKMFWEDITFLAAVVEERYYDIQKIVKYTDKSMSDTWDKDTHKDRILSVSTKSDVFSSSTLSRRWRRASDTEKEDLTANIVRFLRT